MKKLAIFDIDGTLYRWQLYYEVVLKLLDRDFFDESTTRMIREHYFAWQSREAAFHEFEKVAINALHESLPRLKSSDLEQISKEVIAESGHKVYSYTRGRAVSLKQQGYFLLAISGSMQEIAEPFAKRYGFDECIGWIYEQEEGKYTGKTLRKTVGNKAKLLLEFVESRGFSLEDSIAIGDSGGDIDMLELVTHPIAFNPSEELLAAAKKNCWTIAIERKNIIYEMSAHDGLYLLDEARPL